MIAALVLWLVYLQFRGEFNAKTPVTMLSSRAGLVMDPGAKVTYNGVQIGRVASISEVQQEGKPAAKQKPAAVKHKRAAARAKVERVRS